MSRRDTSYGSDFASPETPRKPKRKGWDASLLLVLAVLLVVALVPSLRNRVRNAFGPATQQKINDDVTVWADKSSGTYSCFGNRFYGHGTGIYVKQGDALTMGYQPLLGGYCQGAAAGARTAAGAKPSARMQKGLSPSPGSARADKDAVSRR